MATPSTCKFCNEPFASKNKLFQHLCLAHGWQNPQYDSFRIQRTAVLFGWIAPTVEFDDDDGLREVWLSEDRKQECVKVDPVENSLFAAFYAVENNLVSINDVPVSVREKYPKGYSRCSRPSQRSAFNLSIEPSTHGVADLLVMPMLRLSDEIQVNKWVERVNAFLPDNIKVHNRYAVPSDANEFNADVSATQRRYEIMLPLSIVTPSSALESFVDQNHLVKTAVSTSMDCLFPRDTPEGIARIEYFVLMKKVMKLFNTTTPVSDPQIAEMPSKLKHRLFFHNFVNGGITADESASRRRIDRFYHKQLLSFPERGGIWVVFSISGDDFLQGQVRRIVAVVFAIMKGWLSIEYLQAAMDPANNIYLPLAPSWCVYFAECRYVSTELKYPGNEFDPRRRHDADCRHLNSWISRIQNHIANTGLHRHDKWLEYLQTRCNELMSKWAVLSSMKLRSETKLAALYCEKIGISEGNISNVPYIYRNVLRLLREANKSGIWPSLSMARKRVINETVSSMSGSFSVGCYPRPLIQPKGNTLFPELTLACFKLERALFPGRPPSSTIAINRNAQFKPHRDSGAGNGQSLSLIVALGDFVGGEVLVEDEPHDIRYKPLQFDGWGKRHSTLPFVGERFSLVWFSPEGVDSKDMYWLNDPRFSEVESFEKESV